MAIYRNVSMTFWTDAKVVDDFTPEDRYFYLYLLTNTHTNLCGCYELSIRQAAYETGYSEDAVSNLVRRFEDIHKLIRYDRATKEMLILNWGKYNWTQSEKLKTLITREAASIKSEAFAEYLSTRIDRVWIGYGYPMDTTVSVSVSVTDTDTVSVTDADAGTVTDAVTDTEAEPEDTESGDIEAIVERLNDVCGTQFKSSSRKTRQLIQARMKEGFGPGDFYEVIRKMHNEWGQDPKMVRYLRPETLFGPKFEGYLNQQTASRLSEIDGW